MREPPLNPPDIAMDGEAWDEREKNQEAREEREWAKGWEDYERRNG
jgi:hypothetical protein